MPTPTEMLIIDGVPVVVASAQKLVPVRGGSRSRAFAGNERRTVRWAKDQWQVTTDWMVDADAVALEAKDKAGLAVDCSGLLLSPAGDTISCDVEVTASSEYVATNGGDGTGYMRALTLLLSEV